MRITELSPEITQDIENAISDRILNAVQTEIAEIANEISDRYPNNFGEHLHDIGIQDIRLWIAVTLKDAMHALTTIEAGAAEAQGLKASRIADDLGQHSAGNYRRKYPDAKRVANQFRRAESFQQAIKISLGEFSYTIHPRNQASV